MKLLPWLSVFLNIEIELWNIWFARFMILLLTLSHGKRDFSYKMACLISNVLTNRSGYGKSK